jgi:hypothetical protein
MCSIVTITVFGYVKVLGLVPCIGKSALIVIRLALEIACTLYCCTLAWDWQ